MLKSDEPLKSLTQQIEMGNDAEKLRDKYYSDRSFESLVDYSINCFRGNNLSNTKK
jgi:hypothetical protein